MFRRLERRFIIINMLCVGFVFLLLAGCMIYYARYSKLARLERIMDIKEFNADGTKDINYGKDTNFNNKKNNNKDNKESNNTEGLNEFFTVDKSGVLVLEVDKEGSVLNADKNYYELKDKDNVKQTIKDIVEKRRDKGVIRPMNLFFLKKNIQNKNDKDVIKIALTSREYIIQLDDYIKGTFWFCVIAFFFFGIISVFLSKIYIAPAKDIWERKKQFIADASHELKTPVAVILANNHIVMTKENETVASQMKWLVSTNDEAVHMQKLVEKLLFLAKSDANNNLVNYEKINISEVVMGTVLQFEPIAFEKKIRIDYNVVPDVEIMGDLTQIRQLVQILLDNAVKYTEANGKIYVELKTSSNMIILDVCNTAVALSTYEKEHIFERFFRADKARGNNDGYGLGLPIAKSIVSLHLGEISVKVDEIKGNVFRVKIPVTQVENTTKRCGKFLLKLCKKCKNFNKSLVNKNSKD